jgi:hypothetical protein
MTAINEAKIIDSFIHFDVKSRRWLGDMSDGGKKFRADIQKYNNVFAFTSIGMKQDLSTWAPKGFTICA